MPGLVVVVHHGVTGIGKVSPTVSFSGAKPRPPRMNEDAAVAQRLVVGRGEGARRFWRLRAIATTTFNSLEFSLYRREHHGSLNHATKR